MKIFAKTILILSIGLLPHIGHSQITLTGGEYLINPAKIINYKILDEGVTDESYLASATKIKTYKYFDGFGRPLQDVSIGITPNSKDLIQFYTYDAFGRQTKSYLPFEYTSAGSGDPYQDPSTALSRQASYYTTSTTTNKIPYDTKPWVQSSMEESPMQRLLKMGSAGDGFQTDQHYKTINYRANVSGDNVRKWTSDGTSSGTYSANDLQVTEGTDEASSTSMVFTDKMGRVILKRQQVDATPTYLDTYYIYDLLGNIAFVIPPKGVTKLASIGGTWNVTSIPNLIFSYVYDNKNRVIEKKVPGADVIYMVFDPLDRVVLVQSGNLRTSNKWFYSKYDASGRVLVEGIYTDATYTTRSGMQSYVNGLSCYGSSSTTYYEVRTTGTSSYYTNNCFPTSNTEERLYYYFDDYDVDNNGSADYSYSSQSLPGEGTATDNTLGVTTVVKKRVVGTSNWLTSASFFDTRYNILQVQSDNQLRRLMQDHVTTVIDFAGRLNEREEYHSTGAFAYISVRNTYYYDNGLRLNKVKEGINGGSMIRVAVYEYNALGQLVDKKLQYNESTHASLQSVDYRYNIRGQLTSINNGTLTDDSGTTNDESNDVWGMNILYEQQEYCAPGACDALMINNTSNWTGRISAVKWKANVSGGNSDQRAYVYSYDLAGRMTKGEYKAYNNSSTGWSKHQDGFNEEVTYDENGNISTMFRKAVISGTVTTIDNLTYSYGSGADNNQLQNMTESSSNSYGYRNFTSSSSGYTYDNNGNLTADAKKGITITYSELNKPLVIAQTASPYKSITYTYDAAGVRLSKAVYDGSTTKTYNYIAGQFYDENNNLSYFFMPEGRVRNVSGTFTYEYFITDQQGNVRVSFEDNGSGVAVVRQENSYYPFGMAMASNYIPTDPNKHLYNAGSEFQDEFSGIVDYFSTFFREYDAVIGRFNGVDPMADATLNLSIYHYSTNDPINYNDPLGLKAEAPHSAGEVIDMIVKYLDAGLSVNEIIDHFAPNGNNVIGWTFNSDGGGVFYTFSTKASNIAAFNEEVLEHQVRALVIKGKQMRILMDPGWRNYYTTAVSRITNAFPLDFLDISNFMGGEITWLEKGKNFRTSLSNDGLKATFLFSVTAFDDFAEEIMGENNNTFTFPYLVSTIYHEYIHVYQYFGLNGFNLNNGADFNSGAQREAEAYYFQFRSKSLPLVDQLNIQHSYRKFFKVYFPMMDQTSKETLFRILQDMYWYIRYK